MTTVPPILTVPDTSQKLQQLWTGGRAATPALGYGPSEATIVEANSTSAIVTINGFATSPTSVPTLTCTYCPQFGFNGTLNAAQIPAAGTSCLIALPANSTTQTPWIIAIAGEAQSITPATNPAVVIGTAVGAPTTGTWAAGIAVLDTNGNLWVCDVAGTPGTWVQTPPIKPGQLLAFLRYGVATPTSYTITSTTIAQIDPTNLVLTFTAPPSGNVFIEWEMGSSGLGANALFGGAVGTLSGTTGTTHLGVDYQVIATTTLTDNDLKGLRVGWKDAVTGLTPGATIVACPAAYVLGPADAWILFAGSGNGIANPGPFLGKVTALP